MQLPDRVIIYELTQEDDYDMHCPGPPGPLSALRVSHRKSTLYGAFCMGLEGA